MATIKIILFNFLLIACSIGIFGQNTCKRIDQEKPSAIERVAAIYMAEVGVRELTGRNDGERVEEYQAFVGFKERIPWCAAYVSWVFYQAGVDAVRSAWSPAWFPASNTIYTRGAANNTTPRQADVFGIYFQNLKRIAHVGFVHEWQSNTQFVVTNEGNTNDAGSREGDGVYVKRRLKSQIYKVSRWT